MSCDLRSPATSGQTVFVSIARRRLVVLRLFVALLWGGGWYLVSIARRRLVVLRPAHARPATLTSPSSFNRPKAISCLATLLLELGCHSHLHSFNRPKAISCLATPRQSRALRPATSGFNRPKAISCLATNLQWSVVPGRGLVSIARRRLVVLRLGSSPAGNLPKGWFQSPEGD